MRKILGRPIFYDLFQNIIGNNKRHQILKKEYIGDVRGKRVLELGCGTCDILRYLDGCSYVGIDLDKNYIEYAKRKYSERKDAEFICMDLNEYADSCMEKFDLILMTGVIHHISDEEVEHVFETIKKIIKDDGYFFSFDAVYLKGMTKFEKKLMDLDRGNYVRWEDHYVELNKKHWKNVWHICRNDTMRLPFYIIIFVNSQK